jgi:glycosyltransferase involved in cell wall biosynthesis
MFMKVAFIGQKGIPAKSGGVDIHVENLAVFLAKKNQEVIVYNRFGYLTEKTKEWQGIKLVSLPYINHKNLAAITHGFLATIHAMVSRVEVIHFHGIGPSLLAWLPRLFTPRIKVVSTLHSFDYGNDKWGRFAKFMLRLGEGTMCRFAHQVIVLTPVMHDYLLQRYGRESIIIPNGAHIPENIGSDQLAALGLEPGKYILSLSRIIRLKGIQYLIEAVNNLPDSDLKLAIVGDGEYLPELKKLAANNPRIIFTGNQSGDTLHQLYANAKLFVQSSEMEGLSIALLEAMTHGLPCLASDIIANQEATAETAVYFKSKNVADLQEKLVALITDSAKLKSLGASAKRRAQENFDWGIISDKIIDVYKTSPEPVLAEDSLSY